MGAVGTGGFFLRANVALHPPAGRAAQDLQAVRAPLPRHGLGLAARVPRDARRRGGQAQGVAGDPFWCLHLAGQDGAHAQIALPPWHSSRGRRARQLPRGGVASAAGLGDRLKVCWRLQIGQADRLGIRVAVPGRLHVGAPRRAQDTRGQRPAPELEDVPRRAPARPLPHRRLAPRVVEDLRNALPPGERENLVPSSVCAPDLGERVLLHRHREAVATDLRLSRPHGGRGEQGTMRIDSAAEETGRGPGRLQPRRNGCGHRRRVRPARRSRAHAYGNHEQRSRGGRGHGHGMPPRAPQRDPVAPPKALSRNQFRPLHGRRA
ncbi:MAG: hypothetical protein CL844_05540 [Crocinitomicaceae bacterium]|nr:hypothetical protein [Crocinitomicaceae bacterium]